jgi:hypothetical protein
VHISTNHSLGLAFLRKLAVRSVAGVSFEGLRPFDVELGVTAYGEGVSYTLRDVVGDEIGASLVGSYSGAHKD